MVLEKVATAQLMLGKNWGSGDAETYFYEGVEAIGIKNQAHWQDCIWFRESPNQPWVKASGLCAPREEEKDSYFWTQEKLSGVWLEKP